MQLNSKLKFIFLVLLLSHSAHAVTLSGTLGIGSSTTTNEITEKEGPFSQAYTIEKLLSSKTSLGMEHVRSLSSNLSTSIALTGIIGRFYINSAPVAFYKVDNLSTSQLSYRDYNLYIGSGFGFAQSSRLPDVNGLTSNAAGLYISPRAGFDYQLTQTIGLRSELLIAMSLLGKGSISILSLGGGVYWNF